MEVSKELAMPKDAVSAFEVTKEILKRTNHGYQLISNLCNFYDQLISQVEQSLSATQQVKQNGSNSEKTPDTQPQN